MPVNFERNFDADVQTGSSPLGKKSVSGYATLTDKCAEKNVHRYYSNYLCFLILWMENVMQLLLWQLPSR